MAARLPSTPVPSRPEPRPPAAPGHYFQASPTVDPDERSVTLALPDLSVELRTARGVFARERVDPGTKLLLLEAPRPEPTARTLVDVGCGYGPIAVALALRAPAATVWAVDVNERARGLCEANAAAAGVGERVRVCAPDDVPADLRVDGVWSNPPVRVGKAVLHELLLRWLGRLADDAHAWLVVQRHLGADSLAAWLGGQGWQADRRASRQAYRVLDVHRQLPGPVPHP
jgi:16S rRNA (guanine1207-N2)-methyltransferase